MADLEKVIKGLECCQAMDDGGFPSCGECPYESDGDCAELDVLHKDALELLKTVKPKKRESKALLPCKCGCKRREHWYGGPFHDSEGLQCIKCGFEVWGKNPTDVIRKWNEAVKMNDSAKV